MILIQEQNQKIAVSVIKDFCKFGFGYYSAWIVPRRTIGSQIPFTLSPAAYEYAIEKLHDNISKFSMDAGSLKYSKIFI